MSVREVLKITYQPTTVAAAIGDGTARLCVVASAMWRVKAIFCLRHLADRSWADEGGNFTR